MQVIPVYQPSISAKEKKYVNECLDTNWISSKGKFIPKFEKAFSDFTGIKYSATTSNGTTALHLALLALDIGRGDEVIVPSMTYIASVNAITYTGAKAVFADSLRETWQMDPADVKNKITKKTKAIMVVHLYGHPCDMDSIRDIAKKNNLHIIEDCAEAFGAHYKNRHVGNFGDVATFSFFGNKTITTGEGGMVSSNSASIIEKVFKFKGQGLSKNREYWHDVVGYNYRMTNICAALGLAQIERAKSLIQKKKKIALKYEKLLNGLPLQTHRESEGVKHSYWMCSILLDDRTKRDPLRKHLSDFGVETRPFFNPVHAMPMYRKNGTKIPVAEDLISRGINLPSWPNLTEEKIRYVCDKIRDFFKS